VHDPALLELFTCLREAGLPLGIAEYHLLLESINGGFGSRDRDNLAQLCRTLWVKSPREEQIFQNYFDQIILPQSERKIDADPPEPTNPELTTNPEVLRRPNFARIIGFSLLGATICVVGIGSAFVLIEIFQQSETEPLAFSTVPFSPPIFNADISEKVARIKVIRTGSNKGIVSAKLNIGKKCQTDDSSDTSVADNTPIVIDTPPPIQFADGETGEKTIQISISNPKKADFFQENIDLCLTYPQDSIDLSYRNRATLIIQNKDYLRIFFHSDILDRLLIISTCIYCLEDVENSTDPSYWR
jgi:hypothetical protein